MARKAIKETCKVSSKYPKGVRYKGAIEYRGEQLWIGTFATKNEWNDRRTAVEADFRKRVDAERAGDATEEVPKLTVSQFANMRVDEESGRVVALDAAKPMWPWSHPKAKRSKEQSYVVANQRLRKLIHLHGDTLLEDWTRATAHEYALVAKRSGHQAAHQFFKDAAQTGHYSGTNPFAEMGMYESRRKDSADFEVIDDAAFERLQVEALKSRPGEYGKILAGLIVWMGWSGARPNELYNLKHSDIDLDEDEFFIPRGISKNSKGKRPVIFPAMREAYLAMPRISEYVFPGVRGGRFTKNGFSYYWHPIRAAAGMPELEFYALKHLALTRMIAPADPGPTGVPWGLGMTPLEAAFQAGHGDDGAIVLRYYSSSRADDTRHRIKEAGRAHAAQQRGLRVMGSIAGR